MTTIRWYRRFGTGACAGAAAIVFAVWSAVVFIPAASAAEVPLHVRIDDLIRQSVPGAPAPRTSDAEFLRRLSIDLLGSIPTADEARRFLDDASPQKRAHLIGRLLDHPRYAVHMTDVFNVMLLERRSSNVIKQVDWERYLFESFAANKPYDQLAREILAADGTDPKLRPAVKFYLERNGDPNLLTRDVARIFFGRDLQCCQCHDHPLIDDYHQSEYYGLYAFLQRGYVTVDKTKPENKDKPAYFGEKAEGQLASFQSVFDPKKIKHDTRPRLPGDVEIAEPYYPIGAEYQPVASSAPYSFPKYSRRSRMAERTIASGNRAFRRNIVNRLWAQMMGQGLFEPVDLDHPDNPSANPVLVQMMADEFLAMHYDIKAFLGEIAQTETYQRSLELPETIVDDAREASVVRLRLEAEEKRLSAAKPGLKAEIKKAEQELIPIKQATARVNDELTKSEAKATEAKKAADTTASTLAKTMSDSTAKQEAVKALYEAAKKTRAAAMLLPAEKSLAESAVKFQARAASIADEVKKLAAAVPAQSAAVKSTADKLTVAQQECCRIASRLAAAEAKALPAANRSAQAANRQRELLARINSLQQEIAAAKSIEKYAAHRTAETAAAKTARLGKLNETLAQQVVAIRAPLVPALEDEWEFIRKSSSSDDPAPYRVKQSLDKAVADLSAARQHLAVVGSKTRAAENKAKAEHAIAETQLAVVSRDWSNRFAVSSLRPLLPEQLGWNVMQSLGIIAANRAATEAEIRKKEPKAAPPPAANASQRAQWAGRMEWETDQKLKGPLNRFITLFGAGAGQPQRAFFATVDQALFFDNGGEVQGWLAPSGGNLCDRLLKMKDSKTLAEELYLCVLTRRPSADESTEIDRYLASRSKDRSAAVQEVVWALLTSSEFRFNH